MDPTILFTHLKIILLQYFQFSVFNFSNNKSNPNKPYILTNLGTEKCPNAFITEGRGRGILFVFVFQSSNPMLLSLSPFYIIYLFIVDLPLNRICGAHHYLSLDLAPEWRTNVSLTKTVCCLLIFHISLSY